MANRSDRNPWLFIPTQYFAEGLPFVIVNNLSVVMLKALGAANDIIGYTSFLYLPWSIKPLWSPLVDGISTKRNWVLWMQLALGIVFMLTAGALNMQSYFIPMLVLLTLTAFLSATHDIATDGFYLYALKKDDQAFFSGIRSTFFRLSMIFGSGLLVIIAGQLSPKLGIQAGWASAFVISGAIMLLMFIYHKFFLPYPRTDVKVSTAETALPFAQAFGEYFRQEKIGLIISFILVYRLGEALLLKMAQPFMLDKAELGGLGLSVSDVGFMYGTVGITALVIGGILGGWMVKKYTLRRIFFPLAVAMHLPNLLFVYMAAFKPVELVPIDALNINLYPFVQLSIIIEQFGYGMGFTAFMVYLLYTSKGRFKTSHYAISTGIMALGMMLPGFLSGWLQMQIGYLWLFIICFFAAIPGTVLIFFLPYEEENSALKD